MRPDGAWCEAVVPHFQPLFDAIDCDGVFHVIPDPPQALLWEADPQAFAARYPDSGVVESYGDQWPAPCLDYWLYLTDSSAGMIGISWEGWDSPSVDVPITGDGERDGAALAARLRRYLRLDDGAGASGSS